MNSSIQFGPIQGVYLLGGGPVVCAVAENCKAAGLQVRIITSPRHADECVDGGITLQKWLTEHNFDHLVTEDIEGNDAKKFVETMDGYIALSIGAAWIFTKGMIEDLFENKLLNSHGTRLPQDRGGGGFSWQILRGSREGMCLLHKVDPGIDTGPILATDEFLFPAHCRIPAEYMTEHRARNIAFLTEILVNMHTQEAAFTPLHQCEYLSSYYPRLHTDTHAWVDWHWPADEIEKFCCAFDDPYSGAQTRLHGDVVRLKGVWSQQNDAQHHSYQSGLVYRNNNQWIKVASSSGELLIEQVLNDKGENILETIAAGDRFVTTNDDITQSKQRVIYTPKGMKTKL